MSKKKNIYIHHGDLIDMHLCYEDFPATRVGWEEQFSQQSILIHVVDSRTINMTDPSVNIFDCMGKRQWLPNELRDKRIKELETENRKSKEILTKLLDEGYLVDYEDPTSEWYAVRDHLKALEQE